MTAAAIAFVGNEFDDGLRGEKCGFELADGRTIALPVHRWRASDSAGDELLLDACGGPCLDIGCGPGRLTAALTDRGVSALGIDTSEVAIHLARQRGASAMVRDVFDRVPGEGRWRNVLLADGNIGIGGDPVGLLRRIVSLAAPNARILVELDDPGTGLLSSTVRLRGQRTIGHWFRWAWVGSDSVSQVAHEAGLGIGWIRESHGRWFAELSR